MRTPRKLLVLPALATLLFTFGCGGDSGTGLDDDATTPGTVTFNFVDGTTTSSFSSSGHVQMTQGGEPQFGNWAAGGRAPTNELIVAAFRTRTAPRGDFSMIYVPNVTAPKTATISEACFNNGGTDCAMMYFMVNAAMDDALEAFDRICLLMSGTVSVTQISNQRSQGTFSGMGVCVNSEFENPTMFSVTNGTFNVPIIQGFDF